MNIGINITLEHHNDSEMATSGGMQKLVDDPGAYPISKTTLYVSTYVIIDSRLITI